MDTHGRFTRFAQMLSGLMLTIKKSILVLPMIGVGSFHIILLALDTCLQKADSFYLGGVSDLQS